MQNKAENITEIPIKELIPYENNARTHSEEQISKIITSIKEFGFINPVIIDENNMILVGHGRVLAAERVGMDKAPCIRVKDLTEDQKRAYILADNKLSDMAGWDQELLDIELENIDLDMTLFGFEEIKTNFINEKTDISEKITDSFEIVVTLSSEIEQETLYNTLVERGYQCRISI